MKLFDLHCDTLLRAFDTNQTLQTNTLHFAFDKTQNYEEHRQLMAIYTTAELSNDDAYTQFLNTIKFYHEQKPSFPANFKPILAVEGANLLNDDISRLDVLYDSGVRFLTLVWGGVTCIGGAHNSSVGLTAFGRQVLERCFELGIIPDISHSSEELFWDVAAYGKPFVATHSNSRALCSHKRTITDEMFKHVGLVGISFVRMHLTDGDVCNIDTIVNHMEHFLSLGGEDKVCLGCDFDGFDVPPDGIENVSSLYKIYDRLLELNYSETLADKIFFDNAQNFMLRNGIYQ